MKFSTPATREEKPHCGMDLVPFMNSTTSLPVTVCLIFSSALMYFVLFAGGRFALQIRAQGAIGDQNHQADCRIQRPTFNPKAHSGALVVRARACNSPFDPSIRPFSAA